MTIESDLHRIANALEAIGNYLQRLAYPPVMMLPKDRPLTDDELQQLGTQPSIMVPVPRDTPPPVDASQAFISGQWKRRAGDNIQTAPTPLQRGAPIAPLDPWVRRDVPNVEPAFGQLGIKEDKHGKATDRQSNREG